MYARRGVGWGVGVVFWMIKLIGKFFFHFLTPVQLTSFVTEEDQEWVISKIKVQY